MQHSTSSTVKTTCPYCGVGCGVSAITNNATADNATAGSNRPNDVTVSGGAQCQVTIEGDSGHPANRGNLCLKGQTLGETVSLQDRLLYPSVYGERCSWDTATTHIAGNFKKTIEQHGPESVAFYVSGQLLTEDYYAVNKFVKGYLGTANIDTNSRLCMASSVAGHKRAFGSDTVPGCYEDLELADLVILVGSNIAWCHPVLFNRLDAARQSNPNLKVINIDPRRTASAELADEQLSVKPDSDTALFAGLLRWLASNGHANQNFIHTATEGLSEALTAAGNLDIETVARYTGLSEESVLNFYREFSYYKRVVTVYSQGVNQSVGGTDKVNAIINCHLFTGRIGKPGCGPFSITGQPNAMGGRETGGLANTLTCHMELNDPDHRQLVKSYWNSPGIADKPGLTAVELFNAIHEGKVKSLWIMATNPLVSLPDSNFVQQALRKCEFVIQSDVVINNDTSEFAHVRLPAQAWGEKDGTVTNSERCISRQRRFLSPPGETQPDWWAIAQVADKLGYQAGFDYTGAHDIFAEYAKLSGLENKGRRDFDISAYQNINQSDYNALTPFYWPAVDKVHTKPIRFFADGKFFTKTRRAQFVVTAPIEDAVTNTATLKLNSGRTRDQWHTMTRTGMAHTLANHTAEPFVQIHPKDAERLHLTSADLATVSNKEGFCVVRVVVTDAIAEGAAFIPMHWCEPFASNGKINALTQRVTDPVSKQPALKRAEVTVTKQNIAHYGFALSRKPLDTSRFDYFSKAKCEGGWRYEFALYTAIDVNTAATTLLNQLGPDCVDLNATAGRYSHFSFTGTSLTTALIMDISPVFCARNWLSTQLSKPHQREDRSLLLAATKPQDIADIGELVCTCMEVGVKQIESAIIQRKCKTLSAISKETQAGTNCGSCRSEIAVILKRIETQQLADA